MPYEASAGFELSIKPSRKGKSVLRKETEQTLKVFGFYTYGGTLNSHG